jgi:hypothetical protein
MQGSYTGDLIRKDLGRVYLFGPITPNRILALPRVIGIDIRDQATKFRRGGIDRIQKRLHRRTHKRIVTGYEPGHRDERDEKRVDLETEWYPARNTKLGAKAQKFIKNYQN